MKKKIKIEINGKSNTIDEKTKLSDVILDLKVPLKKVAIELNREIVDKKKLNKIVLKKNDQIEIVHFIGGG
ncbi:sulfur carrier protein ThiS [Pelagibacterales bacterium SAG-MED13]|nr:sulfur carrier protein ThiS [Pelagibacterales bacterium SAG-MED13]|tara:strand:- start:616 stop:828 length:213 start_codon:yes stop_codon:yes gene_type:complete